MSDAVQGFLDLWARGRKARENLAFFVWAQAVGPEIARRSRVRSVQSGVLYADAESPVAASVFQTEAERIRQRLNRLLGDDLISEVRFSSRGIEKERRPPRRAPRLTPTEEDLAAITLEDREQAQIDILCERIEPPELRNLVAFVTTRAAKVEAWRKQKRWKKCSVCGCRFRGEGRMCELCEVRRRSGA
jgi:hypothetical protein